MTRSRSLCHRLSHGADGPPCVRPLAAGRIRHCQGHGVCVVATLRSPQALLWRAFSRLQLWLSWCWKEQLLLATSVSRQSGARTRAMESVQRNGVLSSSAKLCDGRLSPALSGKDALDAAASQTAAVQAAVV